MKVGEKPKVPSEIENITRVEQQKTKAGDARLQQQGNPSGEREDTRIDISLSRYIQEALKPEDIRAERRARVAELKKLIADGNYNPPSDKVAEAIGNEIALEILGATERA